MKKGYQRLTLDERIIIEKQLALGLNHSQIAVLLARNQSSVCRDVKRWKVGHYTALQATSISVSKSSGRKSGKSKRNQDKALYIM